MCCHNHCRPTTVVVVNNVVRGTVVTDYLGVRNTPSYNLNLLGSRVVSTGFSKRVRDCSCSLSRVRPTDYQLLLLR